MTKVILLNGPPSSGKDAIGTYILHNSIIPDMWMTKFAQPIREYITETFAIPSWELDSCKNRVVYGDTIRNHMISYSEDYMKPRFGDDIFAKILCQGYTHWHPEYLMITDSGFEEEDKYLLDQDWVDEALLVRLHRTGYDFSGDSRDYLYLEHPKISTIMDLENNGTIQEAAASLLKEIRNEGT